jgi:hypothetical protein
MDIRTADNDRLRQNLQHAALPIPGNTSQAEVTPQFPDPAAG